MSSQLNLTPDAVQALEWANQAARQRHQHLVDGEHILVGALQQPLPREAITAAGLAPDALLEAVLEQLGIQREKPLDQTRGLTQHAQRILAQAGVLARQLGHQAVHSGHLTLSVLSQPSPLLKEVLAGLDGGDGGLDTASLRAYVQAHGPQQRGQTVDWDTVSGEGSSRQPVSRPIRQSVRSSQPADESSGVRWPMLWALLGAVILSIWLYIVNPEIAIPLIVIVGGWIVSLTLHEFAHALVAYWGGDHTVVDKGYLTLNPLNYTHPLLSLGLPLMFLALGGIGLPGGAVYIEHHRLRHPHWSSLVALAGPFANLVCLVIFSIPFWTGYVTWDMIFADLSWWASLAFLCWLQVTAIFLNMLPIPPLDGFGVIEPFLPSDLASQLRSYGSIGFLLIILLFFFPSSGDGNSPSAIFFEQVDTATAQFGVDPRLAHEGLFQFRFWENN